MNLSAPFIQRPVGTTLLALLLAMVGVVAFYLLPVSPLPQVEFPTISVISMLPGASPEVMATSVASPLERQIGRIAGVTEMTSSSTRGSTRIVVQFDLSRNIDGAARDVQAAINAARSQLPSDLPINPTYRKVNPSDYPILILALTSSVYSRGQMYDIASTILQQKLAQVDGVGQVFVGGSSLPAVRVELNPTALNNYGIGLETVRAAIAATNANRPKGQLTEQTRGTEIITNDQFFLANQYKPLIIAYRNGIPVRLTDVADVNDSVEDLRNAGLANGKRSVLLVVFKQPNANVIETADRVRAIIPELHADIPAAINLNVVMDRTLTIRASLHDVEITLLIAMLLVILVVYWSLQNARAALIPSVAVPLSLLGTFAAMYLLDYSLDNLSLMTLTISTGFVVDDAIVVLENTTRHIEAGMKPFAAALLGAKEVGFTVLSMSISLIAVFIPILLMGGIVGRLFREFAVTLSIAIIISLVISLTLTPMMCAWILKENNGEQKTRRFRVLDHLRDHYQTSLRWALQHSRLMLMATAVTIALTVFLFKIIPAGFFPQQDTGRILATIQADQNISFQAMEKKLTTFVKIVQADPAVGNVAAIVGSGGGGGSSSTNSGSLYISLKPLAERKESVDVVINRLRSVLGKVAGATLYLQAAQDLMIGGRSGNAQFQYTLSANNLADLNKWAPRIMAKMAELPGIADVNSDQLTHGLQEFITIDQDNAKRFGITPQLIDNTLYDAFGQRQVSTMYKAMNQYHVVMEVAPQYWQRPETLNNIYVTSALNKQVPLATFARFDPTATLLSVNHQDQFPATTLSFNLLPGTALGDAVNSVTRAMDSMHLPETVHGSFQGTAKAFQASLASEPYLILSALVAVYIVLGMLYESLLHPITILSTLPSAGVGALLALMVTGTEFTIIALIGIILLIGIVKKNAIMMIDFALHLERATNISAEEAIYQAAVLRFRPIMMTTLAAMLGALPLALGSGVGAELRQPLGITIVGGLLVSQLLTLYTTPIIYLALERVRDWMGLINKYQRANVLTP